MDLHKKETDDEADDAEKNILQSKEKQIENEGIFKTYSTEIKKSESEC